MKVLLTGASGFVGSHILEALRARQIETALLLRSASSTRFLESHLPQVEVRRGSITEPSSLPAALAGITHVIHCAGCTKAVRTEEFYTINQLGTRHLVEAANALPIRRLIHISSLAAAGPALPAQPAREQDPPAPVSEYGKSKLAGELEVRNGFRAEWVVLRPPAVYGPRDTEFLRLFKAVQRHIRPQPARQPLSLVYVRDLAQAIVACLDHPKAAGNIFYAASPEVVTARQMAEGIVALLGTWTLPLPLPPQMFWPLCQIQGLVSRLTGKANVLSPQKYAELRAPGWVCDPSRLGRELGLSCPTDLQAGLRLTWAWYRQNGDL